MEVPYERNQSDLNSFQIILFEGTNAIQVNYLDVVSRGISDNTFNFTTAGIENSTGAIGLKYPLFDTAGRYKNTYVRYMPQQTNRAPEANAGADKSVEEGSKATLDGSGSSDPDAGDALTYKWTQIDGLVVSLSSSTVAKPTFTAPSGVGEEGETISFELKVTDQQGLSDTDTVVVTVTQKEGAVVNPPTPPPTGDVASLVFPHNAPSDGWVTQIGILNNHASQAATGVLTGYSVDGVEVESLPVELPPMGRIEMDTALAFASTFQDISYFVLTTESGTPVGYMKFLFGGCSRAAIAITEGVERKGGLLPKIQKDGGITAIVILNTETVPGNILLIAYDDAGQVVAEQSMSVQPGEKKVALVAEGMFTEVPPSSGSVVPTSGPVDMSAATFIRVVSDVNIVGFQFNYTSDPGCMLDGLALLGDPVSLNTAPVVSITKPATGSSYNQGQSIAFQGSASDKEDGVISSVTTFTSSNFNWYDGDAKIGEGASFSKSNLSVGEHTIYLRVADSEGAVGVSSPVTVTVKAVNNTAPKPTILSPSNNATFTVGQSITFQGSATDTEDGQITAAPPSLAGSNFIWYDGTTEIGQGSTFTKSDLSAGTHSISLKVKDSMGLIGTSATVTITVASTPQNLATVVTITSPVEGRIYVNGLGGTVIPFTGNASVGTSSWSMDGCLVTPGSRTCRNYEWTITGPDGTCTKYNNFNATIGTSLCESVVLTPGEYTATLRAWDIIGDWDSKTVHFSIAD